MAVPSRCFGDRLQLADPRTLTAETGHFLYWYMGNIAIVRASARRIFPAHAKLTPPSPPLQLLFKAG